MSRRLEEPIGKGLVYPVSPVSDGGISSRGASTKSERTKPGLELLCQAAAANQQEQNEEVVTENRRGEEEMERREGGGTGGGRGDEEEKNGKTRGKKPWTAEEDELLRAMVEKYGANRWTLIANKIKGRTGKQARERWLNQLNPELKRKAWTTEEDNIIIEAHMRYGNKWSMIARRLEGRTDNAIKNRFNSSLRRKLQRQSFSTPNGRRVTPIGYFQLPSTEQQSPQPPPFYVHYPSTASPYLRPVAAPTATPPSTPQTSHLHPTLQPHHSPYPHHPHHHPHLPPHHSMHTNSYPPTAPYYIHNIVPHYEYVYSHSPSMPSMHAR